MTSLNVGLPVGSSRGSQFASSPPVVQATDEDSTLAKAGIQPGMLVQTFMVVKKNRDSARTKQISSQTCPMTISEEDDFFSSPDIAPEQETIEMNESKGNDARPTMSELTAEHETVRPQKFRFPWSSWSRERERWTAVGCFSSVVVLTIRLLLDNEPSAYFIHSIVVFVDMVLIHLFTNCVWLSVTGELLTIIFFLSFHFTKETVYELTETTLIAVICSLHMIHSRSKAMDKMEHLEEIVEEMSQSQSIRDLLTDTAKENPEQLVKGMEGGVLRQGEEESCGKIGSVPRWFVAFTQLELRKRSKRCGQHFFEHFLDGSAGVMYTSFAGLIISEIINHGNNSCK
jgi:hypothetical protein